MMFRNDGAKVRFIFETAKFMVNFMVENINNRRFFVGGYVKQVVFND